MNSPPLVTSEKAREEGEDGGAAYDHLVPQYLHEPATVKIEKHSAHPLEADAADAYTDDGEDYYEVTLDPEDGLYPLPYVARRDDGTESGEPFDPDERAAHEGETTRQTFYPDPERIFEEIDRGIHGRRIDGTVNPLGDLAEFEFIRPLPPGGYRSEDETVGEDFFPYEPHYDNRMPRVRDLAQIVNVLQRHIDEGDYDGVLWLEGSPRLEETLYWLQLLLDTELPITGHVANRPHGLLSNDGDRNIVTGVEYIVSGKGEGKGAVAIQDQQVFASREFKKGDARPGAFDAVGGNGGVLGTVKADVRIQFEPTYDHTADSSVNVSELPSEVTFVDEYGDDSETAIRIKDDDGDLIGSEIPRVSIAKGMSYPQVRNEGDPETEVDIMARVEQALEEQADAGDTPNLHGLVFEGSSPYGTGSQSQHAAMRRAAYSGIPVVRVGRADPGGFVPPDDELPTVEGSNLDTNKAAILLTAALLKFGRLPKAEDPADPTPAERAAVAEKLESYQAVVDSH